MTAQTRKATAGKPSARTSAVDAVTEAKPTEATATEATATEQAKPESAAAKASRSAPLDLTALTVEAAPQPKIKGNPGAGRKKADNSVAEKWLSESWAAREKDAKMGGGKAVTVPTNAVGTLKSRLNTAAATLKLGVTIQVTDNPNGTSRVVFAAKVRKVKQAKPTEAKPTEATEAK